MMAAMKFSEIPLLVLRPLWRNIQLIWLQKRERHYLISADVEKLKSDEALKNQKHFQEKAAHIRSRLNCL